MAAAGCGPAAEADAPPAATATPSPTEAPADIDSTLSPDETLAALLGPRRYSGDATERKSIGQEIDLVADQMTAIAAGVAKRRLRESNVIPERVVILHEGAELTIQLDDRTYTGPKDGKPVKVTGITGDEVTMRFALKNGKLEQRFTGQDGGRINTFAPQPNGKMQLFVRVFSERLPDDIRYGLTYRKDLSQP